MNQLEKRQETMMELIESPSIKDTILSLLNTQKEIGAFKQAAIALATNDQLKKAEPESLLHCALEAASLGLPLRAGQGYVVTYKGKAQLDIGYKGWQMMAKRDGYSVMADPVTTIDHFTIEGYGHNVKIDFQPNIDRELYNDKWLKDNLVGMIVSIKEIETELETTEYVEAGMLYKIIAGSPGANSDFSPYKNWLLQMLRAKAIKYVISKMPIDVSSSINEAVEISNKYESINQQNAEPKKEIMSDDRFNELLPQWQQVIEKKRFTVSQLIASISKKAELKPSQIESIMNLSIIESTASEVVEDGVTDE